MLHHTVCTMHIITWSDVTLPTSMIAWSPAWSHGHPTWLHGLTAWSHAPPPPPQHDHTICHHTVHHHHVQYLYFTIWTCILSRRRPSPWLSYLMVLRHKWSTQADTCIRRVTPASCVCVCEAVDFAPISYCSKVHDLSALSYTFLVMHWSYMYM